MKISDLMPSIKQLVSYDYQEIQCPLYEEIIKETLAGVHPTPKPLLTQIGGIPGAGKSTFCKYFQNSKSIYLGFDEIMESIPGYRQDIYLLGGEESFKKWEMPARVIGYEILRRAVIHKLNIFFEHSGVNEAHIELFKNAKLLGYRTEVDYLLCKPQIAMKRTVEREKQTRRHTPKELILERSSLIKKYIEKYKKIADHMYIYDTSTNELILKKRYYTGLY